MLPACVCKVSWHFLLIILLRKIPISLYLCSNRYYQTSRNRSSFGSATQYNIEYTNTHDVHQSFIIPAPIAFFWAGASKWVSQLLVECRDKEQKAVSQYFVGASYQLALPPPELQFISFLFSSAKSNQNGEGGTVPCVGRLCNDGRRGKTTCRYFTLSTCRLTHWRSRCCKLLFHVHIQGAPSTLRLFFCGMFCNATQLSGQFCQICSCPEHQIKDEGLRADGEHLQCWEHLPINQPVPFCRCRAQSVRGQPHQSLAGEPPRWR